jgi:hypothetical protein
MPPAPAGASVTANEQALQTAAQNELSAAQAGAGLAEQGGAPSGGMGFWLGSVPPGAQWDYKQQGLRYTSFGNFNFGATCNVLGLGLSSCQSGAGAAANGTALVTVGKNALTGKPYQWTAGPGTPWGTPANDNGMPVYGDQPGGIENQSVIAGYGYAAWQRYCGW